MRFQIASRVPEQHLERSQDFERRRVGRAVSARLGPISAWRYDVRSTDENQIRTDQRQTTRTDERSEIAPTSVRNVEPKSVRRIAPTRIEGSPRQAKERRTDENQNRTDEHKGGSHRQSKCDRTDQRQRDRTSEKLELILDRELHNARISG